MVIKLASRATRIPGLFLSSRIYSMFFKTKDTLSKIFILHISSKILLELLLSNFRSRTVTSISMVVLVSKPTIAEISIPPLSMKFNKSF